MFFRSSLAGLLVVAACSEYDFNTPVDVPIDDEVEEPVDSPQCPTLGPAPYATTSDPQCAVEPVVGTFDPVTEWNWADNPIHPSYNQIMATPAVANLTDDNGDGAIDHDDQPDVVFAAFTGSAYSSPGALIAISGDTGATLFSITDAGGYLPMGAGGVAIADLDGDGVPTILVAAQNGLLAVDNNGAFEWYLALPTSPYGCPAVGDIDGDGMAEIVFGASLIDAHGTLLWTGTGGTGGSRYGSFPVDLDGDGLQEVVAGNTVYEHDGSIRWQDGGPDGWPAVGDIDNDGLPEVVKAYGGAVELLDGDGTLLWTFALVDGGGGPPTVADFDGDGLAEIGVASREVYRVLDGDGTELWANVVQDYSSSVTGSSVFDFEGDGAAEVVYADEETLWVYDGATGAVEMAWASHSSGTLYEYPLIVDVDNDGAAEIIVASNDYSSFKDSRGITVIGDVNSSWAPARPVWNQHAYYISNVEDDGGVPAVAAANWTQWNSFRAGNSMTAVGYDLPDLRAGDPQLCSDECGEGRVIVWVPVENIGVQSVESVAVGLYSLDGSEATLSDLQGVGVVEAGTAVWLGPIELTRADFGSAGLRVHINDGSVVDAVRECDDTNNTWTWASFPCP